MPRMDGTGPMGQGPRTGRSLGNCQGTGRGLGRSLGKGRGRFSFADKSLTKEEQKKSLLDEKERIEKELSNLEKSQ